MANDAINELFADAISVVLVLVYWLHTVFLLASNGNYCAPVLYPKEIRYEMGISLAILFHFYSDFAFASSFFLYLPISFLAHLVLCKIYNCQINL